jgi:hypothetical protein
VRCSNDRHSCEFIRPPGERSDRERRRVEGVSNGHLGYFTASWTLLLNLEAEIPEEEGLFLSEGYWSHFSSLLESFSR